MSWKFCCHLLATSWGAYCVLYKETWFWDMATNWTQYPLGPWSSLIYWFYMFELGLYIHEIMTIFIEIKRSDFWVMLTHHVSTLILISGSYTCGFIPIGSLVMVIHDVADIFLEGAKLFNYVTKARPWAQKVRPRVGILLAVSLPPWPCPHLPGCPAVLSKLAAEKGLPSS